MTPRRLAILPVLFALLALAGCGERVEPTGAPQPRTLRLMLDYLPNADHAGIYAAKEEGDFSRAGLNVDIQTPSDPSAPLKLLAAGKVDLAISYEPELMLARDKGEPLVAVGALTQQPLTSIMSVGKGAITDPAQLKGKTVGTAGIPYQSAYLQTILSEAGVGSVKQVDVGFGLVPAMLSKRVDATLGAFWNVEGVQLKRAHKHPSIIPVDKAGVPTYDELVFVARANDLRTRGQLFRSFMQALSNAHRTVRRDPARGVDALLAADHDLKRGDTAASVKATLPAFFPSDTSKPFGYMSSRAWAAYGRWMQQNKLVKQPVSPRILTNEFLPGEGL